MPVVTPPIENMDSAFSVKGYNVIVTGGARGLGLGISTAFAQSGANVAILARNAELGAKIAAQLEADYGIKCFAVRCDVSDLDSVKAAREEVFKEFDHIDVIVNNAGVATVTRFLDDADLSEWHRVINTNLHGPANMVYVFGREMVEHGTGGSIINISSIGSIRVSDAPMHPNPPYHASKAALDHIMRFWAIEFGDYGIRVNNILPGPFHSDLDADLPQEMIENSERVMPMHRFGDGLELGAHCVYLASPAGSQITGTIQVHDGGMSIVV
ncbi:MAG: SDR family oxidoreductase [Coriobacteriales bacterium]|nr:SDR family oxidoreductase [Coriobacteriales bacterium]